MKSYTIKAHVDVEVEMMIPAETEDDARAAFEDNIMMRAGLSDKSEDDGDYSVYDDSITEMKIIDCVLE